MKKCTLAVTLSNPSKGTPLRFPQAGLSIVELMVAMALGLILTLGLIQILNTNSQTYRSGDASARVQESGRIAADMISRSLRNAGYFGCAPQTAIVNNLDSTHADWDPSVDEFAESGVSVPATAPDSVIAGTDFIKLSGARSDGTSIRTTQQAQAANIQVTDSGNLNEGDRILVSDCVNADILQITNINVGGGNITLVGNTGRGSPGNKYLNPGPGCTGSNCMSATYGVGMQVLRAYNEVYFIAPGTGASSEPSLFLQDEHGTALELVRGVSDMRIRYREEGSWLSGAAVTDFADVDAVEISLLVRAGGENLLPEAQKYCFPAWLDCSDGTSLTEAPDRRLYRVYSVSTALRN